MNSKANEFYHQNNKQQGFTTHNHHVYEPLSLEDEQNTETIKKTREKYNLPCKKDAKEA